MIKSTFIEDKIKERYKKELINLFSLADSKQIPAICLSGNDRTLLFFFMKLFLSAYEERNYREIINSNDFYEIVSNSQSVKIDDIRKMIKFSTLKKEHLKHKYSVIQNIENANIYAQNSLLKVIEEPGHDTLFLCTSCAYETLLNTIKSRLFRINIPNKPLKELDAFFCDEIRWLGQISFDVLLDFSQLSKVEQKQYISTIRQQTLYQITEELVKSCGEYELEYKAGITFQRNSLKQLYALIFIEKMISDVIFHSSEEVQNLIISFKSLINKKSLYKGSHEITSTTSFNNAFFKVLFSITEMIIYIMMNFQEGMLLGNISYTHLTKLCLNLPHIIKKNNIYNYIRFLEEIKNINQLSLNSELLMINYIILTQKIFNESECKKWE